jgi:hypothetical protein
MGSSAGATRSELLRHEWRQFFERLTQECEGYDVTIEVVSEDFGDQFEAERLPLTYLAYDDKDDVFIVAVGGKDGRYQAVLRHMVEHPKAIHAERLTGETPCAIEAIGPDDTQTIVTLHMRPGLPSPDGE